MTNHMNNPMNNNMNNPMNSPMNNHIIENSMIILGMIILSIILNNSVKLAFNCSITVLGIVI